MFVKESRFYSVTVASKAKVTKKVLNGTERVIMEYKAFIRGVTGEEKPCKIQEIRLVENEEAARAKAKKYVKGFKVAVKGTGFNWWNNPKNHRRSVLTIYGYGMKK